MPFSKRPPCSSEHSAAWAPSLRYPLPPSSSAPPADDPLVFTLLSLLCSYEEASPKVKQRVSAARAAAAPWRAIMRDENDEMIFSMRGLPEQVGTTLLLAAGCRLPACAQLVCSCVAAQA